MNNNKKQKINIELQDEYKFLLSIMQTIFDMNMKNISQSVNSIINKFDDIYPLSFKMIIIQMTYAAFVIRRQEVDVYLSFLDGIKMFEDKNQNISGFLDEFIKFLLGKYTGESDYLLQNMNDHGLLEPTIIKNKNKTYFVHYVSEDEPKKYKIQYSELSKNDWEIHKKLIKEGHNPTVIAKIIRNDEIEQLQEISSQTNFDFDQFIEPSIYERCSFVNEEDVSLIDYAAFFGSVKCFKYLLMNGANVISTGKYAVAGGNEEIIHLCEQNHSTFENAYETAIMFHQNDIFQYIYENKLEFNEAYNYNIEKLCECCILYYNYEIFSFLLNKGMKINDDIINKSAEIGNLYLVKLFLQSNQIPNKILVYSSASGNIELLKYILEQNNVNINAKNIYCIYLMFILIILYFKIIFDNYLYYLILHLF